MVFLKSSNVCYFINNNMAIQFNRMYDVVINNRSSLDDAVALFRDCVSRQEDRLLLTQLALYGKISDIG